MTRLPKTAVELNGDVGVTSYSAATAIARIQREKNTGHHYRGIPEPEPTIESLTATVAALKEVVETLIGQRGRTDLHLLNIEDAVKLNDMTVSYLIEKLGA